MFIPHYSWEMVGGSVSTDLCMLFCMAIVHCFYAESCSSWIAAPTYSALLQVRLSASSATRPADKLCNLESTSEKGSFACSQSKNVYKSVQSLRTRNKSTATCWRDTESKPVNSDRAKSIYNDIFFLTGRFCYIKNISHYPSTLYPSISTVFLSSSGNVSCIHVYFFKNYST